MTVEVVCQKILRDPPIITFQAELLSMDGVQRIQLPKRCDGCSGDNCPKQTHIKPESDGRYYVTFCA